MNWIDASATLPPDGAQTVCYGPELGYVLAEFKQYPSGGGSWQDYDGEVWFASPDQVTRWCELTLHLRQTHTDSSG